MKITEKIKHIRLSKGLTQVQFSDLTGIALGTLRNIEQHTDPSWEHLQRILGLEFCEHYVLWLISDKTAPECGQVSPNMVEIVRQQKAIEGKVKKVDVKDIKVTDEDLVAHKKYGLETDKDNDPFGGFMMELAELTSKYVTQKRD
jgi:transcriptional regulator with XRE-family HTH domain